MKPGFILLLALNPLQTPVSPVPHSQFMRQLAVKGSGESCAILDAAIFAHAAPSLKDLRLFAAGEEIPYVVTLSETSDIADQTAALVDVQSNAARTAFDLKMPLRPYTDVDLDLHQQNFVVTAIVSGADELAPANRTLLGTFTLFDLTSRHLSRNTVLPLQESTFRYLHVELGGDRIAPDAVFDAHVPPSRQRQTLYTPVAETSSLSREGDETVATLHIPAHVPLERVSIELPPRFTGNFDRAVRVAGKADGPDGPVEMIAGNVMRVHLRKIQEQRTSFDAAMGVNLQQDATIRIAIQDGKEAPLPVSAVKLEMRRRSICFATPSTAPVLFYGDPTLPAPRYVSLPSSSERSSLPAMLGPETRNPAFVERAQTQLARRPDLLWLLLLSGFGTAGTIALNSLRRGSLHHR